MEGRHNMQALVDAEYRRLGAAVVLSAVYDAKRHTKEGDSARAFFTLDNEDLVFWCRVANINQIALLAKMTDPAFRPSRYALRGHYRRQGAAIPGERSTLNQDRAEAE